MRSLIVRVDGRQPGAPREDLLAVEEPLEIQLGYERKGWRVHQSVSITMRTPGADRELAAGFLFTEGIVTDAAQIEEIRASDDDENVVRVELRAGVPVDLRRLERHFYTASSCGVCGKASIAALNLNARQPRPAAGPVFDAAVVHAVPDALRAAQSVFEQTGGLHAAALFDTRGPSRRLARGCGPPQCRGQAHRRATPRGQIRSCSTTRGLFVSGRASFELVQKALAAGLPLLAAVGAPSSLAVELAQTHGMTLLGFVRQGRFNIYAGEARIRETAAADSEHAASLPVLAAR